MATRKIKDAKDLSTNELIYFKGHAKATYMSDGKTVEDAINQIGTGGDCQSPYVLPFDIETLDGLSYSDNEGRLQTDADVFEKAKSAIEMGRMVVIRYDLSDAGYHICDATYNGDAISVRVYNGLMLYSFEIYASSQGNILVEQYSLQSELVDGVNIATINGQSLTAGGDITIKGGSDVEVPTKVSQLENDAEYITHEDVAEVALSGSYNDLKDTPTIPSAVTESTVSGWGFTKNTGTYSKPSGGIPKSDLASAVQTSLGKADTAIQSTSFGELADLAVVKGFESAQKGTVYALPDEASGDEDDILLSKYTVKTINGQSLIGEGDITISGGGGSSNGRNLVSSVDLIFSEDEPLLPDTIYYCNDVVAIDISAVTPPSGDYAEYTMLFQTDEDVYITCPDNWLWANGQAPSVEGNTVYELSVVATKFGSDYIYKAVLTPFKSV